MKPLILLDAAHGGLVDGEYVTPGKRATIDGRTIYEGLTNRGQLFELQYQLALFGIPSEVVMDGRLDTPLSQRVARANELAATRPCFYLSIHSNAAESARAYGWECFVHPKASELSKIAAGLLATHYEKTFHLMYQDSRNKIRKGKGSLLFKEADFKVLRETHCPAVLVEDLFMTNAQNFDTLANMFYRCWLVRYKIYAIQEIYQLLATSSD